MSTPPDPLLDLICRSGKAERRIRAARELGARTDVSIHQVRELLTRYYGKASTGNSFELRQEVRLTALKLAPSDADVMVALLRGVSTYPAHESQNSDDPVRNAMLESWCVLDADRIETFFQRCTEERVPEELDLLVAFACVMGPDLAGGVLPRIRALLSLADPRSSAFAIETITEIFREAAQDLIDPIVSMVENWPSDYWPIRKAGCRALASIGRPALAVLEDLLESDDREVRPDAAWALGLIGPTARGSIPRLEEYRRRYRTEAENAATRALRRVRGGHGPHEQEEIVELLTAIESGSVALRALDARSDNPHRDAEYQTNDGWAITIRIRYGNWRSIREVRSPDGRVTDNQDIWDLMPEVAWRRIDHELLTRVFGLDESANPSRSQEGVETKT